MLTATFLITEPCCATRELQASHGLTTIGRALDNSICLADDSNVSRYHAEIELRRDGFYLTDLGSSNGTSINDEAVFGTRKLNDGDRILCGGTSLIEFFQLDSQSPHAQSQRDSASSVSNSSSHASAATDAGYSIAGSAMLGAAHNLRSPSASQSSSSTSTYAAPASSSGEMIDANAETPDARATTQAAPTPTPPAAGLSPKMIAAGVGGGVVLTACAALLLSGNLFSSAACRPSARIITPQTGTSVRIPTLVRIETENPQCIRRVRYQLNGREFAQSSISPFDVPLDPSQLPRAQSANSVLTVVVENKDGAQELQGGEIVIALGTNAKPTGTTAAAAPTPELAATPALTSSGAVATADVQAMSQRLASQISRKSGYVFDREFAELIRARTSEYARAGATGGARRYRREITKAFRDRGLEPVLGFVLAFSVSKFGETAGAETGLWRVPPAVAANFYAPGETAAVLADPKRASEIAAAYTKSLVDILEADNFTYAIACYGMPLDEAGEMSKRLAAADPAERRDFWKMVKSGVVRSEQVDRVTRFYAAGIVAENPSAFGASASEQPFSSLY